MNIAETAAALRARRVSCRELAEEALRAAARENGRLNAFITLTIKPALARATELDEEFARGVDRGPFHGIPVAHKDCLFTRGVRTTWGSKLFTDFVPERDAEVVRRLHEAGAVSIGKTNLHELTYGMTSNNPHFGAVRNPHDVERVAGGSSGGSAAAIAAGIVPAATGTDTGGSIRIPASFCGVVGFKPTYDRVSREGCLPLGMTMDHIGPMATNVHDVSLLFHVMSGQARPLPEVPTAPLRIGLPNRFFDRVQSEVAASVRRAAKRAEQAGAIVQEVALPDVDELNAIGRIVQLSEAAAVLGRYAHRRSDFGADVLALIDQGRLIPATEYLNAQRVRQVLSCESAQVWNSCDCLLAPATPMPAPKVGETTVHFVEGTEDVRMAGTRLTRPLNVLGWPALSIPCGRTSDGLPIGLQLIGKANSDEQLLHWGSIFEPALRD